MQAVRSVASDSKFYQLLPDEENTAQALNFIVEIQNYRIRLKMILCFERWAYCIRDC